MGGWRRGACFTMLQLTQVTEKKTAKRNEREGSKRGVLFDNEDMREFDLVCVCVCMCVCKCCKCVSLKLQHCCLHQSMLITGPKS